MGKERTTKTPKSKLKLNGFIASILQTLWAIGTSVAATGVLNKLPLHYEEYFRTQSQ